ncbi:hypothetical protein [Staphylococcus epidermidis]|uniref:hypothetical protein n=1 Tax=Staphylococcus epidermidis TaxID=1282 RepID=UPI000F558D53|nr:hypothetical protein [Staphylococcus epidermidis]MCG1468905.1 hypothetical protein [Staphylococcus epidermidis]MCG2117697.1 hypothetical protein [Staphylococcus epidermidis]MCO6312723.1 hypothetical protein [Staphylococcus epidermidis]RQN33669.1 hypothetical protein EHZ25_38555 [Paraburkholderia tropica]
MNAEAKFVSSVMDARLKKVREERDSLRKQRDELINDMAETKRKAKAFDEILEITEEDCWAEDFAVYISQVIDKYKEANHEG